MSDIFLSYSREDQATARRYAETFEREGFSVWWDQALSAGQSFDRVTEKALSEARAVVVLWSKRSVESNWVRAEATQAHADGRLVPVMIEPCKRPILFELTHTANLVGWNGDATDPRWRTFMDGLQQSVGAVAPPGLAPRETSFRERAPSRKAIAWALVLVLAAVFLGAGSLLYYRERLIGPGNGAAGPVAKPSEYEQLTNLADSAVAPSLSPDGRMVTFKVADNFFLSRGQIYMKLLPGGESLQLTHNTDIKYGPVFLPDGARISYSQINATAKGDESWDTYVVSVLGGEPTLLLPNASGLTWIGDHRVLFSEIKSALHMGIVSTTESRTEKRDIYWPGHSFGMAHYSWASPDQRSVLIVEMDQSHVFRRPCRLVPFEGGSTGRTVGPPNSTCTSAAWSPDGRWMFFSATVDGSSHLWRQRFPDGEPEQITFGPTEEEGVTVAPDGRSIVTSLGMRRSSIWLRQGGEERPLVAEGYSYAPLLTADGARVYYLLKPNSNGPTATLSVLDMASGRTTAVLPGTVIVDYDISWDEAKVVYTTRDSTGESQVWQASVHRDAPPQLVARNADQVSFDAAGNIYFRSLEGSVNTISRVAVDGGSPQRIEGPVVHNKAGVSPDGQWVVVMSPGVEHASSTTVAVPVGGGAPKRVCVGYCYSGWSRDGRTFYLPAGGMGLSITNSTLIFPVPKGQSMPDLPEVDQNMEYSTLEGAQIVKQGLVAAGSQPTRYVFTKVEFHRNLFRIPVR